MWATWRICSFKSEKSWLTDCSRGRVGAGAGAAAGVWIGLESWDISDATRGCNAHTGDIGAILSRQ